MNEQVWICGKTTDESGRSWELLGVFTSEEKAVAACTELWHFVGPAAIDTRLPDESVAWAGCYYPLAKETK